MLCACSFLPSPPVSLRLPHSVSLRPSLSHAAVLLYTAVCVCRHTALLLHPAVCVCRFHHSYAQFTFAISRSPFLSLSNLPQPTPLPHGSYGCRHRHHHRHCCRRCPSNGQHKAAGPPLSFRRARLRRRAGSDAAATASAATLPTGSAAPSGRWCWNWFCAGLVLWDASLGVRAYAVSTLSTDGLFFA